MAVNAATLPTRTDRAAKLHATTTHNLVTDAAISAFFQTTLVGAIKRLHHSLDGSQ